MLTSYFLETLNYKRLKISERRRHADIFNAYGILHRRFSRSLKTAFDAVEKYESERHQSNYSTSVQGQPSFASDAFLDAIYRAAELFEFYDSDVPQYFKNHLSEDNIKKYKSEIKKIAEFWEIVCNGVKHGLGCVLPIECMSAENEFILGFTYYCYDHDALTISEKIHKNSNAISFNWAFREIICSVLSIDEIASKLLLAMKEDINVDPVITQFQMLPYAHILAAIGSRPNLVFPGENHTPRHSLHQNNTKKQLTNLTGSPPTSLSGVCTVRILVEIYSEKINVQIPFTKQLENIEIKSENSNK